MTANPSKAQRLKYVDFDLPFLLFVRDSLGDQSLKDWADAYAAGTESLPYSRYAPATNKPGHMIIGGGLPVYIPPEPLARYYDVALPHFSAGLRLLRRVNPHREMVMMGEIPGDRTGRASFSSARVMFDMSQILPTHHQNFPLFCELAVQAINHFIDHYRVIANRPYVGPVTMAVIQSFIVTTEFEDGEQIQQHYGTGSGPLHGMGGAIPDVEDLKLREAVSSPQPPSIHDTLDANIRDHLDLQEWRLAVIESAVAFEAWLSRFLRDQLVSQGRSNIDELFLNSRGLPKSITSIAQNLIKEVTGFDFELSNEYSDWAFNVRDLRNDLVHGKIFDVSQAQASEAYSSVIAAIACITEHAPDGP